MRTKSKQGSFATKVSIQHVEIFLSEQDLHLLLGGQSIGDRHYDTTSPAEFYITIKKEEKPDEKAE